MCKSVKYYMNTGIELYLMVLYTFDIIKELILWHLGIGTEMANAICLTGYT